MKDSAWMVLKAKVHQNVARLAMTQETLRTCLSYSSPMKIYLLIEGMFGSSNWYRKRYNKNEQQRFNFLSKGTDEEEDADWKW